MPLNYGTIYLWTAYGPPHCPFKKPVVFSLTDLQPYFAFTDFQNLYFLYRIFIILYNLSQLYSTLFFQLVLELSLYKEIYSDDDECLAEL